jgi:hypothetical protein
LDRDEVGLVPATHGIGMADTAVYDLEGRIGRIIQSQYLDRR